MWRPKLGPFDASQKCAARPASRPRRFREDGGKLWVIQKFYLPNRGSSLYKCALHVPPQPDYHSSATRASAPERTGCLFTDPVKSISWAAPLALSVCLSSPAFAEDIFSQLAQTEVPVLDRTPETDRPEEPETPRPPAEPEVAPVQEAVRVEDLPVNVKGNFERKWRVIPFGRFRVTYDDNLFISNTDPQSDVSFTISPGIAAGWGDYAEQVRQLGEFEHHFEPLSLELEDTPQSFFFAKYVANPSLFVDHSDQDAFDHDALIAGRWEATKLTLGLRFHFQTLSGADIDLGDRVKRRVYSGSITSSYKFSEKTSIELNVYNNTYDYDTGISWSEWILEDWLDYQLLPKTTIAIGSRFGTTDIQGGTTETFEQLVARVTYYASSKLALNLDGGVEWRQYGDGGGDDVFTVFNFGATYAPFDGTTINLNAFRRNSASVSLVNENITATGANARVRQRFMHRYFFTVEGGYQNSDYRSIANGPGVARNDDTVYVRPSVAFDVTKYLSAECAYQFQHNDSTLKETTFSENLVTFQLNLQF